MSFPLTGSSLTASGVTVAIPNDRSVAASRSAGTTATFARAANASTVSYLVDVWKSASVTHTTNPPTSLFPRTTNGLTSTLGGPWISLSVTRSAATPTTFSRTQYGTRVFLPLQTRRPNDPQGRVKAGTDVTSTMRLAVEALNGTTINGATSASGTMAFLPSLAGAVSASSTVTASGLAVRPKNDDYYQALHIYQGGTDTFTNEGATLQFSPYNTDLTLGGSASVWFKWWPPPGANDEYSFTVSSADFQPWISAAAVAFQDTVMPNLDDYRYYYYYHSSTTVTVFVYSYFSVFIRVASLDGRSGRFNLTYHSGTAPDGSYTAGPVLLQGSIAATTQLYSTLPYRTSVGYVDMAKLGPGELANSDEPVLISASTSAAADVTLDRPRLITFNGDTALSKPITGPTADVTSAAGTGVRRRHSGVTPTGGETSPDMVSHLTPYYV